MTKVEASPGGLRRETIKLSNAAEEFRDLRKSEIAWSQRRDTQSVEDEDFGLLASKAWKA